ncbi:MAG: hypothetical protein H0W88_04645 [Parachlamydiaceae bacterium]|nr:hypothetical protein [Parachlamydiaceae bacterium]
MDKYEVAQILREIGMIVELVDENPKKGIAYKRAANAIETVIDINKNVEEQTLELLPGIGEGISKMISELIKKGYLPYYNHLRNTIPSDILKLIQIPGLTLKKIRVLYEQLHIKNLDDLKRAIKEEKVSKLKSFGPAFIKKILKQITLFEIQGFTALFPVADKLSNTLIEILKPYSKKIESVGKLRRKWELIDQLDFILIPKNTNEAISTIINHGLVNEVIHNGKEKVSVLLKQGLVANLYIVKEKKFPFELLNLTGSKSHIEKLKEEAINNNLTLTSNTLETLKKDKITIKSEKDIYSSLGLPWIVPELREGCGEIEAIKKGYLSNLIVENDLRGTFVILLILMDKIQLKKWFWQQKIMVGNI